MSRVLGGGLQACRFSCLAGELVHCEVERKIAMWGQFIPGEVELLRRHEVSNVNNERVSGCPDAGDPVEECEIVVTDGDPPMASCKAGDQSVFDSQECRARSTKGSYGLRQECPNPSGQFTVVQDKEIHPMTDSCWANTVALSTQRKKGVGASGGMGDTVASFVFH